MPIGTLIVSVSILLLAQSARAQETVFSWIPLGPAPVDQAGTDGRGYVLSMENSTVTADRSNVFSIHAVAADYFYREQVNDFLVMHVTRPTLSVSTIAMDSSSPVSPGSKSEAVFSFTERDGGVLNGFIEGFENIWTSLTGSTSATNTLRTQGSAIGGKNVIEHTNPVVRRDYGAIEFTAGLQRRFYRYGKVAAGTDLTYDGAAGARVDIIEGNPVQWRPGAGQRLAIGLYGGYEHVIERFGALVQAGYNVARGFDDPTSPRFYMRYGWRYYVNDRFWGLFAIRSIEGRRADFLEVGAGYRILMRPRTQ